MKLSLGRRLAAGVVIMSMMLGGSALAADLEWTLKKERDGIRAYTAKLQNNDHLAFKGEAVLKGQTLDRVIAVMRDVNTLDKWLHTCYDPETVQEEEGLSRIVYMKNHTPTFLVAERDLVLRQKIERTSPTTAHVTLTGLPTAVPEKKSFVRIPFFDGQWELEQTTDGVRAIYSGVIDPGGGLPTTITNMMVIDTPFETLKKLNAFLQRS